MKYAIVYKTWKNDLCWLVYALQFFWKYWQDPKAEVLIIANSDCESTIRTWNLSREQVYYVDPWPDTYNFHMYCTLIADDFTSADQIYFFDCDIMLSAPTGLGDVSLEGRPIIHTRTIERLNRSPADAVHMKIWFPITEYYLGGKMDRSYMQTFPFGYWRSTFSGMRRVITERTGKGLRESLYSGVPFSPDNFLKHRFTSCDYEMLGYYAALHQRNLYKFKDAEEWPPTHTRHFHSWSQWNAKTQAQLEELLHA